MQYLTYAVLLVSTDTKILQAHTVTLLVGFILLPQPRLVHVDAHCVAIAMLTTAKCSHMQALELHEARASARIDDSYDELGMKALLLTMPTVDNPRNLMDYDLYTMYYEVG